ncbi:MAG: pilus assembly protein [Alkalimonas sp.]|nr:pilus assembly protein [Alkalimonas sp.]
MLNKRIKGQGMTEYLIIVALIAVAAIGVYSFFGQTIRHQVSGLAAEVSGQSAQDRINESQMTSAQAASLADINTNLGNYDATANTGVSQP